MIEQRPFMPHELDVHPDRLRIIATMKLATDSVIDEKLEKEIESLNNRLEAAHRQSGAWANMYNEVRKERDAVNVKLLKIQELLHESL